MSVPADDVKPPKPPKTTPDDALPPVVAPSAGFILQLFLIPLMIVSIIVVVWLMFSWLAQMGSNPNELVQGLKKGDNAAWQKAGILADMLRNPQMEHLKRDPQLAAELSRVLEQQIKSGGTEEHELKLRIFLCRALGEFQIADGLPALLVASKSERDAAKIEPENPNVERKLTELDVRRAALEAIAILVKNVADEKLRNDPELIETLSAAAIERGDPQRDEYVRRDLRSTATFVLGVLGGPDALDQLARALDDPYANVRFNAATGLARYGDARAIPELVEMLDPNNDDVVADESHESGKEFKRSLVLNNAIRSVQTFAKQNPAADLSELKSALRRLAESQVPLKLRNEATETLLRLEST